MPIPKMNLMQLQKPCNMLPIRTLGWLTSWALASGAWLGSATAAQALSFNFSYGANTREDAVESALLAGDLWSSQIADDVSLNIHIDFGPLSEGLLGGARPSMVRVKYEDALTAMFADQTSADDQFAFNHLQMDDKSRQALQRYEAGELDFDQVKFSKKDSFSLLMQAANAEKPSDRNQPSPQGTYLDHNDNENNTHLWMTRANAKALGLVDSHSSTFDATLRFSDSVLWDFDRSDGIADNEVDFLTVIQHEIGHALGFVSGADVAGALAQNSSKSIDEKDLQYVSTLDLFRFSEDSADAILPTQEDEQHKGVADWTLGRLDENGNPVDYYFSLDRGQTKIASLARGLAGEGTDGFQASHWAVTEGDALGVMAPALGLGQQLDISELDTQLLDVLGWDLISVTGGAEGSQKNSRAAALTSEKLVESFWSLADDQTNLMIWLMDTEQAVTDYASEEVLLIESELPPLEQLQSILIQDIEALSVLKKASKDAGDKDGENQLKTEIEATQAQLKQVKASIDKLDKASESIRKWQEKLLKALSDQLWEFENLSQKDLEKRLEKVEKEREKALKKLAEQDGVDSLLRYGRWSRTRYAYRFWQSAEAPDDGENSSIDTVFQMTAEGRDKVSTPEPSAMLGLVGVALLSRRKLRKPS